MSLSHTTQVTDIGSVIDLFERIESFFKWLEIYNQISLTRKWWGYSLKIVIELLYLLILEERTAYSQCGYEQVMDESKLEII